MIIIYHGKNVIKKVISGPNWSTIPQLWERFNSNDAFKTVAPEKRTETFINWLCTVMGFSECNHEDIFD